MSDPLSRYQLLAHTALHPARRSVGKQACRLVNSEQGQPHTLKGIQNGQKDARGAKANEPVLYEPSCSMDAMNALSDAARMAQDREASALGELEATNRELEATSARLAIRKGNWQGGGLGSPSVRLRRPRRPSPVR
jgi:hypothetical protein